MADGHGGARAGAGRFAGGRNRWPRNGTDEDVRKENSRLKRRIDELEGELKYNKPFDGDSKALMTAVYRGDYHATAQQLYAGRAMLDVEYPNNAVETLNLAALALEDGKKYVDNWIDKSLADAEEKIKEHVAEHDSRLRQQVFAGIFTVEQAAIVREYYCDTDGPGGLWELPPRTLAIAYQPKPPSRPAHNGSVKPAVVEEMPGTWRPPPMDPAVRVIYADPGRAWMVGPEGARRRYQANALGEIEVSDWQDEADLLRAGCRAER